LTSDKFGRKPRQPIVLSVGPSIFDSHVLALDIAELAEALSQCRRKMRARMGRATIEEPDHRHRRLLRARRERPCSRRATEQGDERAPFHSITSSARARSCGGTVRPSIVAVWTLMTSSNLVDCKTGTSAGFAPLSTRPV